MGRTRCTWGQAIPECGQTPPILIRMNCGMGVALAHKHGVKVYLTCNTLPLNREIPELPDFLRYARDVGVDAPHRRRCGGC